MPRQLRKSFEGAKYHVTVRGNGRAERFHGPEDYERFVDQLMAAADLDRVTVYAYAVMPNHYHVLVETPEGNIQKFMQRLNTAYAMYYRHKHKKPGHCFQGRYGAKLVVGDDYLLRLTRYIHLNPVKIRRLEGESLDRQMEALEKWAWSSYGGYVSKRYSQDWIDYRWLALMNCGRIKQNRIAYRKYVQGCLEAIDEILADVYDRSVYAIGDSEYTRAVEDGVVQDGAKRGHRGDLKMPMKPKHTCQEIIQRVARAFDVPAAVLTQRRRCGDIRRIAIELCCRKSGHSQRKIAGEWGCSEHAIGKQRQSLRRRMEQYPSLAKRFKDMEQLC